MCDSKYELHKSGNKNTTETSATRVDLDITESTTDTYPEFDFSDLLRNLDGEQKEKKKGREVEDGSQLTSEDSVEALARIYEDKYGNCNDYADLGDGYDEEDSFIDNTDAINDLVPNGLRTEHGGFYINRGKLNFVKEDHSSSSNSENVDKFLAQNRLNARRIVSDDEDEKPGRENGRSNSHGVVKTAKTRKRSGEFQHKQKTAKKMRKMATPKIPDHLLQKKPFSGSSEFRKNINEFKKNRQKSTETEPTEGVVVNSQKEAPSKKKPATVKELLKERDGATEVIEAVARGADLLQKESSSSSDSSSSSSSDSESETSSDAKEKSLEKPKEVEKALPAATEEEDCVAEAKEILIRDAAHIGLDDNLKDLMAKIMELAKAEKNRLSNTKLNLLLLSVDDRVKDLPAAQKNIILEQLAVILQMKRESIIKRTKKLLFLQEEAKMLIPLKKLKEAVADLMPLLESNYFKEFTKAAGTRSIDPGSLPLRRFPWDARLRSYLREIVDLRKNCYFIIRPRKESLSDYIRTFLEAKIKPLWPKDWMTLAILLEESQATENSEDKQKQSEVRILAAPKLLSSYNAAVSTSVIQAPPGTAATAPKKLSPSAGQQRPAVTVTKKPGPSKQDRNDAPSILIPRKTPHSNNIQTVTNHETFPHPRLHPPARHHAPSAVPTNTPRPHALSPHKTTPTSSMNSSGRTSSPTTVLKGPAFRNCVSGNALNAPPKVQTIEIHSNPVPSLRQPAVHLSSAAESLLKEVPPGVTSNEILNLTKNSSISISKVVEDGGEAKSQGTHGSDSRERTQGTSSPSIGIPIPSGITISPTSSASPGFHPGSKPRPAEAHKINVTLTRQEPVKREGALHNIPDCISVTSTSSAATERLKCEPVRKRIVQEYREQLSASKAAEQDAAKVTAVECDNKDDRTFDGFSKIFDSVIAKSVETVRKTENRDVKSGKTEPPEPEQVVVKENLKMEMDRVMQNLMELSREGRRERDDEGELAQPRSKAASFQEAFQKMLFK